MSFVRLPIDLTPFRAEGNDLGDQLLPSSHLLRTPCDKLIYDFPCDFVLHRRWLWATAYVFTLSTSIVRFLLQGLGGNLG